MSQVVTLKIQINDGGTFKDVTVNADDLARAINTVRDRAADLDKTLVDMASVSQIADGVSSAFQNLYGYVSNLTSAYKEASEADTKLVTAMRNTMDATEEEIQSIRDFCDAQEKLGVVSGDVQESAAQELATYLEYSDSLKTLIPVVNDMTVQQYGLNASAESATQIATMLGKVMNGQTKALSRYGYEFTEAQEAVLLYGDEAQRAAMLAEVVGQSVGGMNEAMAKTPIGMMKQAEDRLGKMQERIGAIAISIEPIIKNLSRFASTAADIAKVTQALQALDRSSAMAKVSSLGLAAAQKLQATAARILGVSEMQAKTATGLLKMEIIATEAAITMGLSIAITGLVTLLGKLLSKNRQVEESFEDVDAAQEEFGRAAGEARGQIMLEIGALSNIIEKHKKEKDKVQELNEKYGEAFGYHKTAAEWYDILQTKSEDYCRQLGYEAKAKLLASQYGEALVAQDEAKKVVHDLETSGEWNKLELHVDVTGGSMFDEDNPITAQQYWKPVETDAYKEAVAAAEEAEQRAADLKVQLDACTAAGKAAADSLSGIGLPDKPDLGGDKLKGLPKDLQDYKQSIKSAVEANRTFNAGLNEEGVRLEAMKSGIMSLIGKYGTENEEVRKLIRSYYDLARARSGRDAPLPEVKSIVTEKASTSKQLEDRENARWRKAVGLQQTVPDGLAGFDSKDINQKKKEIKDLYSTAEQTAGVRDAISSIGDAFGSLGEIIGETAGQWAKWAGSLLQAIAQAIPAINTLILKHRQSAAASTGEAVAKGASAVADIPIVGPGMAVAAAATILATIMSTIAAIPKFAKGGIAYGPTLGLFGEYAGASSNPEVVAPVNTLATILGNMGFGGGRIDLRLRGRYLYGAMEREHNFRSRIG